MSRRVTSHPGIHAVLDKENKAAGINIKPSHKGELHAALHIPEGKPIPEARLKAAERSGDPAERKRAQFADNAHKFKH